MVHSSRFPDSKVLLKSVSSLIGIIAIVIIGSLGNLYREQHGLDAGKEGSSRSGVPVVPKEESLSSSRVPQKTVGTHDNDHGKDDVCVIHVGPHKTGSTTLQTFLFEDPVSAAALEKDHYKFPVFHHNMFSPKDHAIFATCFFPPKRRAQTKCNTASKRQELLEHFELFVDEFLLVWIFMDNGFILLW